MAGGHLLQPRHPAPRPEGHGLTRPARFAFVVHALAPFDRRVMGVRWARPGLALGTRDGTWAWDVGVLARVRLGERAEGVVVGVPMVPEELLADQERAVRRMERAVNIAAETGPLDAVGLGSLCAVVGGRGEALAERLDVPVTTGNAATAWALFHNARELARARGEPVGLVGVNAPVGRAVAALLSEEGIAVRVDGRRGARGLEVDVAESPDDAVAGCPVVVGAGPTGATVAPEALAPGAVVVDVALPGTVRGRPPRGVRVLAGEAVGLPTGWDKGFWGRLYHVIAGYGPWQVFACFVEPLVLAVEGRSGPYALGRRLEPATVRSFGDAAEALGFRPRLARGWLPVGVGGSRPLSAPTG